MESVQNNNASEIKTVLSTTLIKNVVKTPKKRKLEDETQNLKSSASLSNVKSTKNKNKKIKIAHLESNVKGDDSKSKKIKNLKTNLDKNTKKSQKILDCKPKKKYISKKNKDLRESKVRFEAYKINPLKQLLSPYCEWFPKSTTIADIKDTMKTRGVFNPQYHELKLFLKVPLRNDHLTFSEPFKFVKDPFTESDSIEKFNGRTFAIRHKKCNCETDKCIKIKIRYQQQNQNEPDQFKQKLRYNFSKKCKFNEIYNYIKDSFSTTGKNNFDLLYNQKIMNLNDFIDQCFDDRNENVQSENLISESKFDGKNKTTINLIVKFKK